MTSPALIFDFGNVVAFFDFRKTCASLGRHLGLTGEALLERVRSRGFSHLVQEFERGRITAQEFSHTACGLAGLEISHAEFAAAWSDIFRLNEPIARLVAQLKASGYPLLLGSNTNELHAAQFRRQFASTVVHFDHLILSHEIGHIKPAAPFYLACARAAGTDPENCVFIDDLPENVAGAQAAGLTGLLYRDPSSLIADLRRLGVRT